MKMRKKLHLRHRLRLGLTEYDSVIVWIIVGIIPGATELISFDKISQLYCNRYFQLGNKFS